MKRPFGWLLVCGLLTSACMGWADELGHVPLPYSESKAQEIDSTALPDFAVAEPRSMEEELEALKNRDPVEEDVPPRVIQDLDAEPVQLSVADLRLRVLQNNLDLIFARFAPDLAVQKSSEEIGKFDAVLGSKFAYKESDTPKLDSDLVEINSLTDNPALEGERVKFTELEQQKELSELGLGIKIPTLTGGFISLDTGVGQKEVLGPAAFEQYTAATRFTLSQRLLRGGGVAVNIAPIQIARVGERLAQAKTKLKAILVLSKAEKSYWKLWGARRLLDIRTEQLRLGEGNLQLVEERVQQGFNAPIEADRARSGVAKRVGGVLSAELAWSIAQRDLKTYMAAVDLPLYGEPMVAVTSDPTLVGIQPDRQQLVDTALRERLELIAIELQLVRDGLVINMRENEALPFANLFFQYGLVDRQDGYTEAWGDQFDFDNNELTVGFEFELPVTNRQRDARLQQALLTQGARYASQAAARLQVEREVHDALDTLQQTWQRIAAARFSVIVAARVYALEQEQFLAGLRTQTEVFEALSALGDAQIKELKAILDYQIAQIDIAFATGTVLGYAGIDIEPLPVGTR